MRRNKELTRVTCSGIVDADDYHDDDVAYLDKLGVAVLPVSEIENVILLPAVSRAIAESEGYRGADLEIQLSFLNKDIFATLTPPGAIDSVVARYCRRRIDRLLKKIDLSEADNVADLSSEYDRQTAALDIAAIAREAKTRIETALREKDLQKLLANYDNKGLMALAARHFKGNKLEDFKSWLTRVLRNNREPALETAIRGSLPNIHPE
jgi:hypothetical protein